MACAASSARLSLCRAARGCCRELRTSSTARACAAVPSEAVLSGRSWGTGAPTVRITDLCSLLAPCGGIPHDAAPLLDVASSATPSEFRSDQVDAQIQHVADPLQGPGLRAVCAQPASRVGSLDRGL